jgi:hypothetical protein
MRVLGCGVRYGKTTAAVGEATAALNQPCESSIGWVCGPTFEHADRIFERVKDTILRAFPYRLHSVDLRGHRLVVRNLVGGLSEMWAKSADQPTSLLGEGLDWLILDEAARLKRSVWEEHLSSRLVDRNGWALLLSTPVGRNWFYRLYRKGQRGNDPSIESWARPTSDNPHLDSALIERERARLPADAFSQQYLAQFTGPDDEPCPKCEGPSYLVDGWVIVQEGERPGSCPECEGSVNGNGQTLVGLTFEGEPSLTILEEIGHECPEEAA